MENIKNHHIQELKDLLKRFTDLKSNDTQTNHFGRVVNNNDPGKLGRCKIMTQEFDGLSDSDLPWAVPDYNLEGNFSVPEVGHLVNVYFRDNDINFPHYTTKVLDTNTLSDLKNDDYPNTFILFETERGDYLKINKKTNEFMIRTAGGAVLTVNSQGNFDLDTTNCSIGKVSMTARGIFTLDAPFVQFPNGVVTPTGTGFFCAMPIDPLTGLPQTGSLGIRQGGV